MSGAVLPSIARGPETGFPLPFRRAMAEDTAFTAALLLGCLIGVVVAWQVVLSEEARGRILGRVAGLTTSVEPAEASEPRPRRTVAALSDGMLGPSSRPPYHQSATRPEPAAESAAPPEAAAAAAPVAATLPERLVLAEEQIPAERMAAREGGPAVTSEIVFDLNSSFLAPGGVATLRELAERLEADRAYRLDLRAAVSDAGVKGADAKEAARYNRWLAERRLERVAAWLREHAGAELTVERAYLAGDPSRRVTISARPLP